MAPLLADQLDMVLKKNAELGDTLQASLTTSQTALATSVTQALTAQQDWVQKAIASAKAQQDAERLRVSALWWSEALYSPRLRRSYRELPPVARRRSDGVRPDQPHAATAPCQRRLPPRRDRRPLARGRV
ncbi:MAG: hypothetical protein IPO67_12670 [Deltaproteobacteria bacterium]|nr:hypothetical protein [Deltaproteobacteria bacterium]